MNIQNLKEEFYNCINKGELMEHIFELKKDLLSSDSNDFLEFHYSLLNNQHLSKGEKNLINSFFYTEIENNRDTAKVGDFIFFKYKEEKDIDIKANLLRILGHLRLPIARELSIQEIKSPNEQIRYSSIIVLGWIGKTEDLNILNEGMLHDPVDKLREYSATAMRQIWYNHKSAKTKITKLINEAIRKEDNQSALVGMIITIQTLYKKKLGIKESAYGDISGDVLKAKEKTIKELDKIMQK